MDSQTRWTTWLEEAKRRGDALAEYAPMATRKRLAELERATPTWYESSRVPVQDPPNLIEGQVRQADDEWAQLVRRIQSRKPQKPLYRAFHGKAVA